MKTLRVKLSSKFFAGLFFSWSAQAAPPVDLTDVDAQGLNKKVQVRKLTEEDITFTDSSQPNEQLPADAAKVLYKLDGRSKPARSGDRVQALRKGEFVKVLGFTKSKRWVAIQVLHGKRVKAWVPASALQLKVSAPMPAGAAQ